MIVYNNDRNSGNWFRADGSQRGIASVDSVKHQFFSMQEGSQCAYLGKIHSDEEIAGCLLTLHRCLLLSLIIDSSPSEFYLSFSELLKVLYRKVNTRGQRDIRRFRKNMEEYKIDTGIDHDQQQRIQGVTVTVNCAQSLEKIPVPRQIRSNVMLGGYDLLYCCAVLR